MGKIDFKNFYQRIKNELGTVTCKTSFFCDQFNPQLNYAGVIVYAIDEKFQWKNAGGKANGYDGRSFYIIIQCIDQWPDQYRTGPEKSSVHDYLLKNVMGLDYDQNRITCGGFSYTNGQLDFTSKWLNTKDQKGVRSDRNASLSDEEKLLVTFCFNEYKNHGPHHIFPISKEIDETLSKK